MKRLLCAGLLLSVLAPWSASAAPISAYGGTLDATLRFFDIQHSEDYSVSIALLRSEYQLGIDFMPAVPLSFQQSLTPYSGCLSTGLTVFGPNCFAQVEPIAVPGTSVFTGLTNDDPSQLGALVDACAPGFGRYQVGDLIAMIARGNCSFSTKWENAEAAGYPAVLVENNVPGPVGGIAPVPGAFEPTIPFFLITQAVAQEIRTGSKGYLLDGSPVNDHFFPLVQMRVTWTPPSIGDPPVEPPVETVPEPSSMLLSLIGAAGVALARRRPISPASSSTRAARCDASSARSRCR